MRRENSQLREENDRKIELEQSNDISYNSEPAISGNRALEPQVVQEMKIEIAEVDQESEIEKAEQVSPIRENEQKIDGKKDRISGGAGNRPHPRDEPER